jgi:hypothetical protein
MKYKVTTATEAHQIFDMLGIKNVSTRRQKKNGTQVYELPIQQVWQTLNPKPLRFACYRTGYVRNISESNSSCYQINKTKSITYKSGMTGVERILIPTYDERLVYLANFILKNYYQKTTYVMNDYVMKCLREAYVRDYNNKPSNRLPFGDEVQVIVNGHRYNLS